MTDTPYRLPWRSAGLALIGAALFGLLGVILRSHQGDVGVVRQLAEVADSPEREILAASSWIVATMLFVVAGLLVAIIGHARSERGTFAGGVLMALGGPWISTAPAAAAVVLHAFGTAELEGGVAREVGAALDASQAWLLVLPMIVAFTAAPVVIAIRTSILHKPFAVAFAVAWIVAVAGAITFYGNRTGETVFCGAMMLLHMAIGAALVRHGRAAA